MTNKATIKDLLRGAANQLAKAGVETPDLDARLLLQHATGLSHAALIGDGEKVPKADRIVRFEQMLVRRLAREPVSRIIGRRAFWGLDLAVSPAVLDPRADTECLIEAVLEWVAENGQSPARIADIGTGSGAIILALLGEFENASAMAVDISNKALEMARANAKILGMDARIEFICGSYLEPLNGKFDLIVSNPPYIKSADIAELSQDVREYDPLVALDGGADGLDAYRILLGESRYWLNPEGALFVEIGHDQAMDVCKIADECGWRTASILNDMAKNDRVCRLSC